MKLIAGCLLLVLCHVGVESSHPKWECDLGPRLYGIRQIDAGLGQVVATTKYGRSYQLSGRYWYTLGTYSIQHVSVGPAGTWGTDSRYNVFKLVAGNWKIVNGQSLQQVDAGGDGSVVGVDPSNDSYCQTSDSACHYYGEDTLTWTGLEKPLIYVSCGKMNGCWGIDTSNRVFVTTDFHPSSCLTSWTRVGGKMKMIEVSTDGRVFGVSLKGKVFQRLGITDSSPEGDKWKIVPMCMPISHVTYDLNQLWVVTNSGWILQCSEVEEEEEEDDDDDVPPS